MSYTTALQRLAEDLVGEVGIDERYFNDDLADLDTTALCLERTRLRAAVVFASRPDPWVVERLSCIERVLKARRVR